MKQQRTTTKGAQVWARDGTTRATRLIGVSDLAAMLDVHERHIYRLVAERRIPYIKWGHLPRFDAAEVQRWLDSNRVEPLSPPRR